MEVIPSNYSVSDYCRQLKRNDIVVNRDYQRSDKVWPPAARSFLVETILLGFPMPKLALHEIVDRHTREPQKEIVDGQQRSTTILSFFEGSLRVSRASDLEEARGRTLDELPDELQSRFLNYRLSADVFVGATRDEMREMFRRLNSYTVPLNAEEQRHAVHQGEFKWFIHRLAGSVDELLVQMGTFGEKQLVRMQDTKLLTEFADALLNGIRTTKKTELDRLYASRDKEFAEEEWVGHLIVESIQRAYEWEEIRGTALTRPHMLYSLLLAVAHLEHGVPALSPVYPNGGTGIGEPEIVLPRLTELSEAVEEKVEVGPWKQFVAASSKGTNVEPARTTRFKVLCDALISH